MIVDFGNQSMSSLIIYHTFWIWNIMIQLHRCFQMNTSNKNNSCTQAYFFFLSLLILTLQKRQFPYLLTLVVQRNSVDIHTNVYKMWHTNSKTYRTYQCMTKLCFLIWQKLHQRTNLNTLTNILVYDKLLSHITFTRLNEIMKRFFFSIEFLLINNHKSYTSNYNNI